MPTEPQTLTGALTAAIAALAATAVHLYRDNQKAHAETRTTQEQMLRVMVVAEKVMEDVTAQSEKLSEDLRRDFTEMREAIILIKERQEVVLHKVAPGSPIKSPKNLPH